MIDLHSHTNQSDGSCSPEELIAEARRVGVHTLAITDHDTFAGYDQALPCARESGVELLCGIELSTKLEGQSVHLLGYFLEDQNPGLDDLRLWILEMQASRRERNIRLVARLQSLGLDITLAEAQALGRGMTGRPHFARILVEKGYVKTIQQAFDDYLAESARGYVDRYEPQFAYAVERIRQAGGIASLAHPVRLKGDFAALLPALCDTGLNAIEAYHSDHEPADTQRFLDLAQQHGLRVTGGSDFHGSTKPGLELGTGRNGNVQIPADLLARLRPSEGSRSSAQKGA
jgi:predicted metal-dependent phosphoesterase TrpH